MRAHVDAVREALASLGEHVASHVAGNALGVLVFEPEMDPVQVFAETLRHLPCSGVHGAPVLYRGELVRVQGTIAMVRVESATPAQRRDIGDVWETPLERVRRARSVVELEQELDEAREALGRAWSAGGVRLAEAIQRKTLVLEAAQLPVRGRREVLVEVPRIGPPCEHCEDVPAHHQLEQGEGAVLVCRACLVDAVGPEVPC